MNAVEGMTCQVTSDRSRTSALLPSSFEIDAQFLAATKRPASSAAPRRATGALERLIQANIRLVQSVARRYRCRSYSTEDLVQEGILGLMLAVERFDENRGCRLNTYALHWIRQAITRAAERNDRLIHVPVQAKAELKRLQQVRTAAAAARPGARAERGRAVASGRDPGRAGAAAHGTVQEPVSLEALVGEDQRLYRCWRWRSTRPPLTGAGPPDGRRPAAGAEAGLLLRPRERWVVEERFGLAGGQPQTLEDLSRTMKISREGSPADRGARSASSATRPRDGERLNRAGKRLAHSDPQVPERYGRPTRRRGAPGCDPNASWVAPGGLILVGIWPPSTGGHQATSRTRASFSGCRSRHLQARAAPRKRRTPGPFLLVGTGFASRFPTTTTGAFGSAHEDIARIALVATKRIS